MAHPTARPHSRSPRRVPSLGPQDDLAQKSRSTAPDVASLDLVSAARLANMSTGALRRRADELIRHGAVLRDDGTWSISIDTLITAGLLGGRLQRSMRQDMIRTTADDLGVRLRGTGGARRGEAASESPRPANVGHLGNVADNSARDRVGDSHRCEVETKRVESRRRVYGLRRVQWDVSDLDRVRDCGWKARTETGHVGVREVDGRAGYSGVTTCGSPWACPVCARKIAGQRGDDLFQVLDWGVEQDHTVVLSTMTLQHQLGELLRDTWTGVAGSWSDVTKSEAWAGERASGYAKRLAKWEDDLANGFVGSRRRPRPERRPGLVGKYGVLGFARAFEVTYGEHGWHPHIHVILVLEGKVPPGRVMELGERLFTNYRAKLERRGYSVQRNGGFDMKTTAGDAAKELAKYLAKSMSLEATHGHMKKGRRQGRTPFQLLEGIHAGEDLIDAWHEYEHASHGRRQITWSQGLRTMAGLVEDEKSNEAIVEEDLGTDDLIILEDWSQVRRAQLELLEALEVGMQSALNWLDGRQASYMITAAGLARLTPDRRAEPTRANDDG